MSASGTPNILSHLFKDGAGVLPGSDSATPMVINAKREFPFSPVVQPVLCVSFPRSGSYFFKSCLEMTIGPSLKWCEGYTEPFDPEVHNMLKSHDYDLEIEPPPGWAVVLQLRDPLDAVPSWYDKELEISRARHDDVTDCYEYWRWWAPVAFQHWLGLARRWLHRSEVKAVVWHSELELDPRRAIRKVARLMTGRDPERIRHPEFAPKSCRERFRHYRLEDFREYADLFKDTHYE